MKKIIRNLLIAFFALLVIVILSRNIIGVWATERTLEKLTGLSVTIEALDIHLTLTRVVARHVTILNPKEGYREKRAVVIDLLDAEFEPLSFLKKNPHFKKLIIEIPAVVAVKNAAGEINLKRLQSQQKAEKPESSTGFKIDEFVLSLGEVIYMNEASDPSKTMTYKVDAQKKVYQNISNPEDVKKIIMNLVIESIPGNLLGLSIQSIDSGIKSVTDLIKEGTQKPLETLEKGADGVLKFFGGKKD